MLHNVNKILTTTVQHPSWLPPYPPHFRSSMTGSSQCISIVSYRHLKDLIVWAEIPSLNDYVSPTQHGTCQCTSNLSALYVEEPYPSRWPVHRSYSTKHLHHHWSWCCISRLSLAGYAGSSMLEKPGPCWRKFFYDHRSTVRISKHDTPVGYQYDSSYHYILSSHRGRRFNKT